jgi:hypothetical protein
VNTTGPRIWRHHEPMPEEQVEGLVRVVAGLLVAVLAQTEAPGPSAESARRGQESLEVGDGPAGSSSFVSS